VPREQQARGRVRRQFRRLARGVVREKDKSTFIDVFEEHRARARPTRGIRGGEDHRVRLDDLGRRDRVREPPPELLQPRGREVGFGQPTGQPYRIIPAHRGELGRWHGYFGHRII
jgi:hypothetical protein